MIEVDAVSVTETKIGFYEYVNEANGIFQSSPPKRYLKQQWDAFSDLLQYQNYYGHYSWAGGWNPHSSYGAGGYELYHDGWARDTELWNRTTRQKVYSYGGTSTEIIRNFLTVQWVDYGYGLEYSTPYDISTTTTMTRNPATGVWIGDGWGVAPGGLGSAPVVVVSKTRQVMQLADIHSVVNENYPPDPAVEWPDYFYSTYTNIVDQQIELTQEYTNDLLFEDTLTKLGPNGFANAWTEDPAPEAYVKIVPDTDEDLAAARKIKVRVRFQSEKDVSYTLEWTVDGGSNAGTHTRQITGTGDEMIELLGTYIPTIQHPSIKVTNVKLTADAEEGEEPGGEGVGGPGGGGGGGGG